MWQSVLLLILGFIMLVWSADRFVSGAAATARNFGLSKVMIGLTIVSVGTSAPEILVALAAAVQGTSMLAIGNAIGSNIANVGLVLGVTAIIRELPFARSVLRSELPILIAATLLALLCLINLYLGRLDGIVLLAGLGLVMYRLVLSARSDAEFSETVEDELGDMPKMSTSSGIAWLSIGLAVLLLSADILVGAATDIAHALHVSELIIGLTVVAVGTSLPELAATIGAAVKGHPDIAIGNVVGSNILNILAVMAVPAVVKPVAIANEVMWRDYGMMLGLTMLLVLFAYGIGSKPVITRFEGMVLVCAWVGYNLLLYSQA